MSAWIVAFWATIFLDALKLCIIEATLQPLHCSIHDGSIGGPCWSAIHVAMANTSNKPISAQDTHAIHCHSSRLPLTFRLRRNLRPATKWRARGT